MKLLRLFQKCVNCEYIHVENSGDYYIERQGSTLYIYLECSNGSTDWKNNLDFPAKPYKRMGRTVWFAHRGFLKVWKSIEDYLAPFIKDETIKKIVIVGYSHGAALAVLCHEYVWYNRPDLRDSIEGYGFKLSMEREEQERQTTQIQHLQDDLSKHFKSISKDELEAKFKSVKTKE